MIDPSDVVMFDAPVEQLEEFLMFGIMVAGKPADRTARLLNLFLKSEPSGYSPFDKLTFMKDKGVIEQNLRDIRTGQYTKLTKAFQYLVDNKDNIDLRNCTVSQLQQIPGVGPKTARYFKLYTDKDFEGIPLDTHLLKFLRDTERMKGVPKSTPSHKSKYQEVEQELVQLYHDLGVPTMQQFDLTIWVHYSEGRSEELLQKWDL